MARRFLDDVRSDITTLLADNDTENITPAIMRGVLTDMVDSTISDECAIFSITPSLAVPTTDVFAPIALGVFDDELGGDGDFLNTDFAAGVITGKNVAGYTYILTLNATYDLEDGFNFEMAITINGDEGEFFAAGPGRGIGEDISASIRRVSLSSPIDAVFGVAVRTPNQTTGSVNISAIVLEVDIVPTNNP